MNRLTLAGLAVLAGSVTAPVCMTGTASALPNCGGQNAAPQPVPYTCFLPGRDITYQGVTRHFSAVVFADGVHVTVTYTMSAPVPVDVPIRIVHHTGISGAGLGSDQSQGFIPAGQTTATLVDSSPCREGQLDVKAVNTANGSGDNFRVGGPWIRNGDSCIDTTTIPSSSTTTAVTSSTVPPPSSTPGTRPPVESTAPTSRPPVTSGGGTLPPTGNGLDIAGVGWLATLVVVAGGYLVHSTRKRAEQ